MTNSEKTNKILSNKSEQHLEVEVLVLFDHWRQLSKDLKKFCSRVSNEAFKVYSKKNNLAYSKQLEISIVLSDDKFIRKLNIEYCKIDKATNVLAFSNFDKSKSQFWLKGELILLGDIVISYETVIREAQIANKLVNDHFTHMIVHGVLHLMGLNHQNTADAAEMEGLEIETLNELGIPSPYFEAEVI